MLITRWRKYPLVLYMKFYFVQQMRDTSLTHNSIRDIVGLVVTLVPTDHILC